MNFKNYLKSILFSSFLLLYLSGNGQTYQWAHEGVSQGYDYGNGIITDDSGNVYIGGQIEYSAHFGNTVLNTNGKHDILIAKYNTNGTLKWAKHAGGVGGDLAWGVGIDKFHNVFITGEFEYTAGFDPGDSITVSGSNDIFLAKYDADGDVVWLRRMGGGGDDKAKAIAVNANGSSFVTGYFSNTGSFGSFNLNSSGGNDFFIAKYSPSGTCQWVKKAGGSSEDRGRGVVLDPFGNLYVVGTFSNSINFNGTNYTGPNTNNAFIAKYDTSGNFQWVKTAGACCDTSRYNGVTCDASGNAYATGYFKNAMNVGTNSLTTIGNTDIVIAKYSPTGTVLWAKNEGGDREDMGYHVSFDNKKNLLYVTGFYDYQADFDSIHLTSAGNRDAFLVAYNPAGNVQWARTAGGNARDCGQAVACDTLSNIYQTGFFNSYADFDATHLIGDTLADFFITKSSPAPAPQPTVASTALSASIVNCNDVQLNWTSGNGSKRIVIARSSQSANAFPSDGNIYLANTIFGNGADLGNDNFVVYNGSGNSTVVSGLTSGNQYSFIVIEYNGDNLTCNYNNTQFTSATMMVNSFAMHLSTSVPGICAGGHTTLSVSGGMSYQWSPAYQLSSTTGSSVEASPAISTTYTVEGIDNSGCHSIEQIVVYVNPLPFVQFDHPVEVCEGAAPITLSGGNPSGGIYSGISVSNSSFDPTTANTGLNIVSYSYTDANGCSATDTSSVFINALPVIAMPVLAGVCINSQPVVLAGESPVGGTYSGSAVASGNFDPSNAVIGANTINYEYTDNHGCMNSATTSIEVFSLPVVSMTAYQPVCANATPVTLSGGSPAGGTFSGTGVSSTIFEPMLTGPGNYIITYTYSDANNCSNAASTIINVKTLPSVYFASLIPACVNGSAFNLGGGIPSGGNYSGTGVSANMFDPSVTGAGNFLLSYSYTDGAGCTNEAQQSITVNPLPVVSFALPSDICTNSSPLTLAGGNPMGGSYSGVNVSSGKFSPQNLTPGPYSITYTYTDQHNCTNEITKTINVQSQPIVNLGADSVACAGSNISLDAGAGFTTYHWSNGASTQLINVSMGSAGSVNCIATVTNSFNCSNSDTIRITFDLCSGISKISSDYPWCYFYPNPFRSTFTIFSEKKLQIRIFDVSGRLIEEHECQGSIEAGRDLSSGVYFIDAIFNNQRKTYKVIKAE